MRRWLTLLALAAIVVLAFGLRLVDLSARPPHHDEGVNGRLVETMLRTGYYDYDPGHFHGPAYFYLLYLGRRVLGFGLVALRIPGALVGACACFLPLLVRRRIGLLGALAACTALAASPTLVYYARYAIHETLLASLGLLAAIAIVRADGRRAGWLVVATAAIAGMFATKETAVIFVAAGAAWAVLELVLSRPLLWPRVMRRDVVLGVALVALAFAIHVLAFTGGFHAPDGVRGALGRSLQAFARWHDASEQIGHDKPCWYYLALGVRYELVLYALAVGGAIAGRRDPVVRSFAVVGFAMLAGYSLIPYKMPWLPASWLALLSIPAGYGVVAIRSRANVPIAALALVVTMAITIRSSFVRPADPGEDLAYVHTDAAYQVWTALIARAADKLGAQQIQIAVSSDTPWPLPYTLAPYPRTRWPTRPVGDEDIVIASLRRAPEIAARLHGRYLRREFPFRPHAERVVIFVRADRLGRLFD